MTTPENNGSCSRRENDKLMVGLPQRVSGAGDLELRLLQAFSEYAGHAIVSTYATVKHSSRILGFAAASTETVVTKAGLVAIVRFFYNQYMKLGHPVVRFVDEAMGRRIVATFVQVLLAVEYQQKESPPAVLTVSGEPLELTFYERLQALLYGYVPRLQTLIVDLQEREKDAESRPPASTFNPEDYVGQDEFQRLRQDSFKTLAKKEEELAALRSRADTAESDRRQLEQDMKRADANQVTENHTMLAEKEQEIAALKAQVAEADRAREQLAQELRNAQEQHQSEQDKIREEKDTELTTLKEQAEAAARAREQLTANLREALSIKDEENNQALSEKEKEVEALKTEIQAAEIARKKLEQDLDTTRVRMETEHKKRVKELEDELARAKHIALAKDNDARGDSLREQRASFNTILVKDHTKQSQSERMESPKSPVRSEAPKSPVRSRSPVRSWLSRSRARSGDNQVDHDELTRSARSSASSATSSASPRMSEEQIKEKLEKEKLQAGVRRVLGSRF